MTRFSSLQSQFRRSGSFRVHLATLSIFALGLAASSALSPAAALSSAWVAGHKVKARLVAGRTTPADGGKLMAFVEIALEPGWKTYWRSPGDAGLPPSIDWAKSGNVASAEVLYPAPRLFTDKSGHTIGYEGTLFLPIALTPKSPGEPVSLAVEARYGICKDICVPIEAELKLDIPAGETALAPAAALIALDRVPRPQASLVDGDPVVVRAEVQVAGDAPKVVVEARFPAGDAQRVVYLEASNGQFLPIPAKVSEGADGLAVFEAPLGADVDLKALMGATLTATLVGETGASYATFKVPQPVP
jgi:DsbC/DsbD-like thiol-disulfide interchange protein